MSKVLCGDVRLNKGDPQITCDKSTGMYVLEKPFHSMRGGVLQFPVGFAPTLHEYRFDMPIQKKKPGNLLVCSMGDLFGDWISEKWIMRVFDACAMAPHHNYLFLTRNPGRYDDLADRNLLPRKDNHWYGTTVTKPDEPYFSRDGYHSFICIEPIHADFGNDYELNAEWVIVGAESGQEKQKVAPQTEWIQNIYELCRRSRIPLYMCKSRELKAAWKGRFHQKLPAQLQHEEIPIPHCKSCDSCKACEDGKRGMQRFCTRHGICHIPGRYTRTSPPWCELRKIKKGKGVKP